MKNAPFTVLLTFWTLAAAAWVSRAAESERPFMGAYIHMSSEYDSAADVSTRNRQIAESMERFASSGLHVIIPYATSTSGAAHYNSRLIPDTPASGWDPLAVFVREARRRGLQVYPAACVLSCGGDRPQGILKQHPEWALRDKNDQPLGFLSAGNPDARAWVVSVLEEIVTNYPVDGLLLDYLRFPSSSARLDPASQARFDQSHPPDRFPRDGKAYKEALLAFKRECLTELAGQIRSRLREVKPEVRIAVYMWGAHELSGTRDWRSWAARGYLDMLNLTGYSYPRQYGDRYLDVLKQRIDDVMEVVGSLQNPVDVTICIGVKTSHGRIRSAKDLGDYFRIAREGGVCGAAIFTWTTLQPYLEEVKKAGYFEDFVRGIQ